MFQGSVFFVFFERFFWVYFRVFWGFLGLGFGGLEVSGSDSRNRGPGRCFNEGGQRFSEAGLGFRGLEII